MKGFFFIEESGSRDSIHLYRDEGIEERRKKRERVNRGKKKPEKRQMYSISTRTPLAGPSGYETCLPTKQACVVEKSIKIEAKMSRMPTEMEHSCGFYSFISVANARNLIKIHIEFSCIYIYYID